MASATPKIGIDKTSTETMDPMDAVHAGNGQHRGR